ncbi:MAG: aldolase/citrate lyase family protein [Elusimicrobiales bacterium]|nr:aldolase/citrate lyase family protein [Elusimicrobiales bacterium]
MSLKEKLEGGNEILGSWAIMPSPEAANVMIKAGLDFVLIDLEHGPADYVVAQRMVMAAEAAGGSSIIRVGEHSEAAVLKALDTGTGGVIVPHVSTREDAQRAVSFMMYPPDGERGYSPYTKAGGYFHESGFVQRANRTVLKGVIVEGENGIDNLDDILAVKNLDLVYVGTYDISSALGIAGQTSDPRVLKVLEESAVKIRKAGKAVGCLFKNEDELHYFRKLGIKFLTYKVDTWVLYEEFKKMADIARGK